MIAILQRVLQASVTVENTVVSQIGPGLLVFLGVHNDDGEQDVSYMAHKIPSLRIFSDEQGKMNYPLRDIPGELLMVSQFTLLARTSKGRRPSFENAAPPAHAQALLLTLCQQLEKTGLKVKQGVFGAHMRVSLENDGPVTLMLNSRDDPKPHSIKT